MDNTSSSRNKSNPIMAILLVIVIIIAVALAAGWLFNRSKIDQLTKSLQETQKQVQDVQESRDDAKQNVADSLKEGMQNVAGSIQDIQNPAVRVALTKAYLNAIKSQLTAANQKNVDAIIVYIEKNPTVLVTKNPTLPAETAQQVAEVKAELRRIRAGAVATMKAVDKATYSPGEVINLQGTIEFVEDDPVAGGSIFTLTDTETGYEYYLHFNETNSANIKNTMDGKEVKVTVKVTSRANEPLTFQVVQGPTLVTGSTQTTPAATVPPAATTAPQM